MDVRRHLARRLLLSLPLALALTSVIAPGIALAADEPNGNASCVGLEQASISPPGSSDEEPGGSKQFVGEVKELAAFLGVEPGALLSFIARLHAGGHEACDAALAG